MYFRPSIPSRQAPSPKSTYTPPAIFPAAVAGWISNQNLAEPVQSPQGAALLENFFPTATGIITRRGSAPYAQLGSEEGPVRSLFTYVNGNNQRFFGATDTAVYDVTVVVSPLNLVLGTELGEEIVTDTGEQIGELSTGGMEAIQGMNGGLWINTQFATTGGVFLIIVNGDDPEYLFDGSRWFPIDANGIYALQYTGAAGEFVAGESIIGDTSRVTGTIVYVDSSGTSGTLYISGSDGGFQNAEEVRSSSASAFVNGEATAYYVGIEGIGTNRLDYVWVYKSRLFYVEKDSMNAWYLPVDQVGGEAKVFSLGGEFTEGGKLLFGAAWSLDSSGAGGLSEQCVFISDRGQVVVYQGLSPDDPDWQKVGTYKIGRPLGPRAWFRAGGDLIIATDIGDIPLSQAIQRDFAALAPAAVSYPIEAEWNRMVDARGADNWQQIIWPERQMVVIALPTTSDQPPEMLVANARTGAWSKFTNWNGTCLEIFNGRLFFGSEDGKIMEAYVGGLDEGTPFTASYVPLFSDMGSPAARKISTLARAVLRGPFDVVPQISVMEDYTIELPPPPASATIPIGSRWDVGTWGESQWGGSRNVKVQQGWVSASGYGYALSPSLQLTSGSITPLDVEVIRLELLCEPADIVT